MYVDSDEEFEGLVAQNTPAQASRRTRTGPGSVWFGPTTLPRTRTPPARFAATSDLPDWASFAR